MTSFSLSVTSKIVFLSLIFGASEAVVAQDDLLNTLEKQAPKTSDHTQATFKGTRIISGHSVETVKAKHLDFMVSHRFGRLNEGAYNAFGLDFATLRLGFEYGFSERFTVGLGRSSEQKTFDLYGKYRLLRQAAEGSDGAAVSVTMLGSLALRTLESFVPGEVRTTQDNLTYTAQALIARKINEDLSIQLTPTLLYRNKPERAGEAKALFALGLGGRYKLSKRFSVNAEYFWTARDNSALNAVVNAPRFYDALAIGVDIETGGHVFQIHFTNSVGMIEKQFIGETSGRWGNGDIHWGFNLSRTFSFDRRAKTLNK
jgi:Membrane bound beta barrel domain (DUF5777)